MKRNVYQHVGALRPGRTVFNNSHSKLYDCDMGQLIPVCFMECVPGDVHDLSVQFVVRFQPLVAPVLHDIYMRTFYFFVPWRLIMNRETMEDNRDNGTWEDFITGGQDGNDGTSLRTWESIFNYNNIYGTIKNPANGINFYRRYFGKYSLWDYFGLPIPDLTDANSARATLPTDDSMPLISNVRCYNLVFNEYFRDQNVDDEVNLDNPEVRNVRWQKDRFTSALYDTQRGDRPAIPLAGIGSANFNGLKDIIPIPINPVGFAEQLGGGKPILRSAGNYDGNVQQQTYLGGSPPILENRNFTDSGVDRFTEWLDMNSIDFSNVATFDAVDMRRLFQLQKYLERNMRVGARYAEQLPARFGVRPQDYRLQRPEFIGGSRTPIVVSEVLQTSESSNSSKQGNLAGHGISADSVRIGRVRCYEHGYIIGFAVLQPKAVYVQGIPRELQRRTRYDFLTPELVNLSEVAIKNSELVVTGTPRDDEIFGFQGIYDEYRVRESFVCGDMRDTLNYWHLARTDYSRQFPPSLNSNFLTCVPDKRIFAVQNVPGCIVHFGNRVRSTRPLPIIAEPGLIDHH